ncbi:hypothetical protein GCM10028807_06950 [Spirosoma daeguense]
MRKNLIGYLLGSLFLLASPAFAQKDKRAQAILDAMSKQYKSLKSYQASFNYSNTGAGAKESVKGDLMVKGEKFRLALGDQEVFTDGQTMYTYLKESNEMNVQDFEKGNTSELNPTQIYNIYKQGFDYKFLKEQKQGSRTVEVIELTAKRAKSPVSTVQLSVDKVDKSVRNWLIVNKDGSRTTYTITKFTPNANVADTQFIFNKAKYPGVEVIDLR